MPPLFVQDACWHYNRLKRSELDEDPNIIDFARGLNEAQKSSLKPAGSMSASKIQAACQAFWQEALGEDYPGTTTEDVPIYEHVDFPGLQLIPSLLPPQAQLLFVSQIMHPYLANPLHTTNLTSSHPLTIPSDTSSLFLLSPNSTHTTPPLTMSQYLSSKLRYLTLGTQYHWPTRSYPTTTPTPFPPDLSVLVRHLFPHIRPESGVCLLYGSKDFMPVHRDVSEQCQRALASFSFGCDGIFLVARGEGEVETDEEKKRRLVAVRVRSGDVVHLDGETRWAWHAMPRTIVGTGPEWAGIWPVGTPGEEERREWRRWKGYFGGKRLNVSCRQVWD
ncbi:2OG-Fe(II) oxygenase-like protein 3 [Elsinoe fawcettii]|nr:2OG-Fe(II) oxygenase-like protein 3 [Elsinoe fawcettii]